MTPSSPYRLRFGLRTLFVVMTVVAVFTAWVASSLNWIRQRNRLLLRKDVHSVVSAQDYRRAPGGLWVFDEAGISSIDYHGKDVNRFKEIRRLFPEAWVRGMYCPDD